MAQVDQVKLFADVLHSKHGVEARTAVLEQERVEFIRGKDFARYIAANQDKINLTHMKGKAPEEQAQEIGSLFLRRQLLIKCDRMFKKPPPGQDRLIKFPKKLIRIRGPDAMVFSPEAFYAWTFDRPTSPWVYLWSFAAAVGVILICLFPMAPYSVKISVVYLSAAILIFMLGTLSIRNFIAITTWIVTGKAVWLLPNLLADDKPINQLFTPLVEVSQPEKKGSKWNNHPLVRVLVAAGLSSICWVLYSHAPNKGAVVNNAFKYRDEIFEMLNMQKPALHGESATTTTMPPPAAAAGGAGADSSSGANSAGTGGPGGGGHVESDIGGAETAGGSGDGEL